MKVIKTIKALGCKQKGTPPSNWWFVSTTDGEIYSSFNSNIGEIVEGLAKGDTVNIEYQANEKGFKNISAIEKEIDVLAEEESPEKIATALAESHDDKTLDIHRQVAWKIAGSAWGWFDLEGQTDSERMKKLAGFAKTVEEILNG